MSVNKYKTKLISYFLCLSMVSGNFLTVNAAEIQTTKNNYVKSSGSNYSVIMPKAITLDKSRYGEYSVTVTGDIPCSKRVYVSPVDGIEATEKIDFYMKDQTSKNGKADVAATITQNKVYWNYEEVSNAYMETGNVNADELSAGTWKGTFEIAISLLDDPDHNHQYTETITKEPTCTEEGEKTYICECGDSYTKKIPATEHSYTETITKEPTCTEEGEKTYTCECGDSYTEKIPATGHSYIDGKCEHCGEKDPNHEHQYTETITKEPTCIEEGEKTYTCKCGDSYTEKIPATGHSYTEKIPATGHNYVDGICENCGESDPNYHEWKPLYFSVSGLPVTKTADGYVSGTGKSVTKNNNLTITVPEWYPQDINYTYNYYYSYDPYCSGSVQCGSFSTYRNSTSSSSSGSDSGSKTMALKPGNNAIIVRVTCTNGTKYNSVRWLVRGTFPSLSTLLDKTQHYCVTHGEYEVHYTSCTDKTKDEYYFCEACGLQFRHRCKFDDADISFANCEGGDVELTCVDDYYDTTHELFNTCGQPSTIHFDGLGHDWQPWIVQVNPDMTIDANSNENKYTFTKSTGTSYDTYRGSIAIANGSLGSSGCSMSLEIILPDNFEGTYTMPITYNISSSSFTKTGYRMTVNCHNNYTNISGSQNKSYLSYDLGYANTSTGTTSGTMNVELHPGKNVISFSTNASTNLSSWQTGSNGGPSGSVSFTVPHTPFYIYTGKEVHKCSRCNLEESHTDNLYEVDRVEATCINDGYIRYTCNDCNFVYDEKLPKHSDKHKDVDHDYICDDCDKDLKTCEEFGHVMEHIKKTYEIPVTYSASSGSKWYVDDGFYRLNLEAGKSYNSQGMTITYNVPSDFPGTHYSDSWRYIIVYNGKNGGKWNYESTASIGKHTGGPYMSSGYVPLTLKAGICSIYIECFSLGALVDVGTQFVVSIADSISLDLDVYHCTRCGRTEDYDFSSETVVQSLNEENYSDGDTVYVENASLLFDDIETIQKEATLSEKSDTDEIISDETKKDNDISQESDSVTETYDSVFEEESSQENVEASIKTTQEEATLSKESDTDEVISDETKKDNDISQESDSVTETYDSVFEEESSQENVEASTDVSNLKISSN